MLAGATLFGRRGSGVVVNLPLTSLAGKVAGGLTYTRASGQWYQDDAGVWQYAAANVPAFNAKGVLLEPGSTNKCTCYGTIPADAYAAAVTSGSVLVLGRKYEIVARVTTDFTTKGATDNTVGTQFVLTSACTLGAGDSVKEVQFGIGTKSYHNGTAFVQNHTGVNLSGDPGFVVSTIADAAALGTKHVNLVTSGKTYRLDNSAGAGAAFALFEGTAGNANACSGSAFVKTAGTSGLSALRLTPSTSNSVTLTNTAGEYVRVKFENKTPTATDCLEVRVNQGEVVDVFIPQLEELPFCTSPMPTAGATATRAVTLPSFSAAGNIKSNNFTVLVDLFHPVSVPAGAQRVLAWYVDLNNRGGVYVDSGATGGFSRVSGVTASSVTAAPPAVGATQKIAVRFTPAGVTTVHNGNARATSAASPDAVMGETLYLGSDGQGGGHFNGYIKNLRIYRKPLSDAQLIAMTT